MSNNILPGRWAVDKSPDPGPIDPGGGGGDNGGMDRLEQLEKRVNKIDDRLGRIEGDVSSIKMLAATIDAKIDGKVEVLRADIHKAIHEQSKWTHGAVVGMFSAFILGVLGLLFTIYNASKPAPTPTSQQSPVIIQVPSTPTAAPAPQQRPSGPEVTPLHKQ